MIKVLANKSRNFAAMTKFITEQDCRIVKVFEQRFGRADWADLTSAMNIDLFYSVDISEISGEIDDHIYRMGLYEDFYHDSFIISTNLPFNEMHLGQLRRIANRIMNHKPSAKILVGMVSDEDCGIMNLDEAIAKAIELEG